MLEHPIAVLGGGNIGHMAAADFSLAGYKVNFYEHPNFADAFKTTLAKREIEILDDDSGRHEKTAIHKVTVDIKEALEDARLVFMTLPSFGQELFFNTMIPHLKEGHVVVILAGNLGSLRLRELLRQKNPKSKAIIYETNTMPGGARLLGPAKVRVLTTSVGPWLNKKEREIMPFPYVISAVPANDTTVALKEIQALYPIFVPDKNVLVAALNQPHHLIHTPVVLLNAGRIETSKEEFIILADGQTPAVQRIELAIRDELAAMARVLGGTVKLSDSMPQGLADLVKVHPITYRSSGVRYGPEPFKNRFVTEDTPYGLVPMSQLGEKLKVPTPLIDAFIDIASAINREDYRKTGRTFESLGLAKLTKEQVLELVENG